MKFFSCGSFKYQRRAEFPNIVPIYSTTALFKRVWSLQNQQTNHEKISIQALCLTNNSFRYLFKKTIPKNDDDFPENGNNTIENDSIYKEEAKVALILFFFEFGTYSEYFNKILQTFEMRAIINLFMLGGWSWLVENLKSNYLGANLIIKCTKMFENIGWIFIIISGSINHYEGRNQSGQYFR